jgi:hypothetical protein
MTTAGILHNADTTGQVSSSLIVDADVKSDAAIAGSKLAAASGSVAGAITTGTQTIAGEKTFSTNPVFSAMSTAGIVHNAGTTGALTSSLIVDADVKSDAAIAGSKLAAASDTVAGAVTTGAQTLAGVKSLKDGLKADAIDEITSAHGVIIDSLTIKDGNVTASSLTTAGIVHNSVTTGAFTSSLIVDADVKSDAAIAGSKIVVASGATAGVVDGNAATWNGVKTFASGISFGNETLSVYDEGSFPVYVTDGVGGTGAGVTAYYIKCGGIVHIFIPECYVTTTSPNIYVTDQNSTSLTWPAALRPARVQAIIQTLLEGASVLGIIQISTNGLRLYKENYAAFGGGSVAKGIQGGTFSYILN